ncbi:MAG: ATP-dependent Clp protease ATP-binding subunit ClpC [Firmicutes bacterium HGW-Firmicutes-14]|nr:MAG: ATP-dependent Clp protease ATP-binding subunit ClpC [Firmicutes bacterium HGW-Firmicutes-14]
MFGRFTERAQKVLMFAQEEARRLHYPYVGTEHLLLGLLREGEGIAARVLQSIGIELDQVRAETEKIIGKGGGAVTGEIGFTPRSKKVLELSFDESRNLGHNYIGTEHLLLGLIREGEGVAAAILQNLGANLQSVRQSVIEMLNGAMPSGSQQKPGTGKSKTPNLDDFGRDLTALAKEGKLDPVVGREKEIERVIQVLSRRTKNNPVLMGEPGVGKTAIAEGLAQRIEQGNVPETIMNRRVVTLDLASVVAGTKFRGEFEERLKKVMDEIRNAGNIIMFIDELHTLIGAGAAEGAIDAANILKPALARGELQCIGATTLDEYRKYIERDPALERRFQPITVEEPTVEESLEILKGLRDRYEAHHRVNITDEAISAAVRLSDRYITDRFLPDKAIDLIDEAASRVRLQSYVAPPGIKEKEGELEKIRQEKEAAISAQEFEKAAKLRDKEQKLKEELDATKKDWDKQKGLEQKNVTEEDIAHIVSSWTGIPVRKLAEEESERLLKMEEILHERVIGQDEAVKAVSRAVRRARAGLKDPKRPIGSFIFLGPTGVGKTELARALAEALFGEEDLLIRIDMSEYMEKHAVSRLVGAPPGYVGYDEGGQLTEAVRRKPYSVILLDEIEKAHPEVFNILLQVLEDGRLTDAKGRTVDFRNTVVIMTSNVGAEMLKKEATLGFRATGRDKSYEDMKDRVTNELRRTFRPEFLNRIDEIIVFHALSKEHIKQIVGLMVKEVAKRLAENDIKIEVSEEAREFLSREGFDQMYGARPLRRAIQKFIEDRLSEEILTGKFNTGDTVRIGANESDITVEKS